MVFNKGDLIEVSKAKMPEWSLESLQSTLPTQITDEVIATTPPITRFAEIIDVQVKNMEGEDKKVYTLRFSSDHTLQVEYPFLLSLCVPHGPSVHAKAIRGEE